MIDPIAASSSADGARLSGAATPAPKSTRGGADFAGELARYVASSTSTSKATDAAKAKAESARPKDEKLAKVSGHPYSRVANGDDKGMYLNQLDNSPREGKVFKLVKHDGHVLHVYGSGKDKVVVEVKSKAKTESATAQPTGGATPSTTTSSTTAPSTTTPSTT